MMKRLYAALAVAGFVLPMSQFALFVRDHGFDLRAFLTLPFANSAASTLTVDLLVSCAVFFAFVYASPVRHRWAYVAMTLLVGLSFALPMFLLARYAAVPVTNGLTSARMPSVSA
jgi:Terpene cyclase DEP1